MKLSLAETFSELKMFSFYAASSLFLWECAAEHEGMLTSAGAVGTFAAWASWGIMQFWAVNFLTT